MRRPLALVLLVALLAAPGVSAACTGASPCVLQVRVTDDDVAVAPAEVEEAGTYVLRVANFGSAEANVTLEGHEGASLAAPAQALSWSRPFDIADEGSYTLSAGSGPSGTVREATLSVDLPSLWAILLPVFVGLALIVLATVVLRSGRQHRHNVLFAALYLLSGLKSLSEGVALKADQWHAQASLFPAASVWGFVGTFCILGIMPLLFLFVSSFPHPARWMQRSPRAGALAFVPSAIVALLLAGAVTGTMPADGYFAAAQGFNVVLFAVTVSAVFLLLRTRARSPDPIERNQALYVLLGFVPSFTMGWLISGIQWAEAAGAVTQDSAKGVVGLVLHYLSPVAELLAASLVAFAILRYNILGISPRFRLGVKSAVAGLMFVTLFFLTQFVENVILQGKVFAFAGDYGSFILSGLAGLVLFKPIEKVSDRASSRLLPGAAAHEEAEKAGAAVSAARLHAEQIYHAQATYVLRDAKVTDRELAFLANLRQQLGLSEEQGRRIEEDVERILKVDAPQTGASAAPAAAPQAPPPPGSQ